MLANRPALRRVTGAHVWNINSVESVAYEYSRYNYNATDFYAPNPFRSSDHDPLLVGFDVPGAAGRDDHDRGGAPKPVVVRDTKPTVTARVAGDGGTVDGGDGDVLLRRHGARHRPGLGRAPRPCRCPRTDAVGPQTVTVTYCGGARLRAVDGQRPFDVVKATPTMAVRGAAVRDPQEDDQPAALTCASRLPARRSPARSWSGRTARSSAVEQLAGGAATVVLPPYKKKGEQTVHRGVPRQRPRRAGHPAGRRSPSQN